MSMNTIKVLIFDFDGTLYSGKHKFDFVEEKVNKNRRKFLPNLNDEQYECIAKENPDWLKTVTGNDIVKKIYDLKNRYPQYKIDANAFWQWQNDDIYEIVLDKKQIVNPEFIHCLSQLYPIYIVSNSSPNHIKYYMKKIGISEKFFKEIISNRFHEEDITKKPYYEYVAKKEKVSSRDVYIYGDSNNTDLLPGKKLGMNTYLIEDSRDIEKICFDSLDKDMIKEKLIEDYLLTCDLEAGYVSMRNQNFNQKYWEELKKKKDNLSLALKKIGVKNTEIQKMQSKLKDNGEILENF